MLTLNDFKKVQEIKRDEFISLVYVAVTKTQIIEIDIIDAEDKSKRILMIILRDKETKNTIKETYRVLDYTKILKKGQINEILLKGVSIANCLCKEIV